MVWLGAAVLWNPVKDTIDLQNIYYDKKRSLKEFVSLNVSHVSFGPGGRFTIELTS